MFNEDLHSIERIAAHCVSIAGAVRREKDENPDYHVHSQKARELTEEKYHEIYTAFMAKYDVIRAAERPLSLETEADP